MTAVKVNIGSNGKACDFHLCPGQNLFTGIKYFDDEFTDHESLEEDMFNLAAGIYGADLCVMREEREKYIRSIKLKVEVVNLHAFERIKDKLESALFTVSRDNWDIEFIQIKGTASTGLTWTDKEGAVLLFSGGIDSMVAAADFVGKGTDLVLVSHNSHGNKVVDDSQNNVHKELVKYFKKAIRHIHIKVYGRKHLKYEFPEERENTQRTRSFLFLTLATLITRKCGFNKVLYMAENGQFAIHLPLNQARVGPFSTHTADPQFVLEVQEIFQTLFNNAKFEILNPLMYKTKAEVFGMMPKQLQKVAHVSASCWKISHVPGFKHCGYCIPCISRRIAIEFNGESFSEYHDDVFAMDMDTLDDANDRKRNLVDYLEFISKFKKVTSANKNALLNEFPELYNPAFDKDSALALYNRVSQQSLKVFESYPHVKKLLG